MIILIFGLIFLLISVVLYKVTDYFDTNDFYTNIYNIQYIKGSTRGSMGRFVSNSMIEAKRKKLKKKKSMF